jgi:transcription elongation factor GreB
MIEEKRMSRAFTKEVDDAPDNELIGASSELPPGVKNYMTPLGHRRLADELRHLTELGRPEAARLAAQAAAASESLEEQTQKRRLRQIEARMQFLRRRLEQAEVVDPLKRGAAAKVFFGATVRYANRAGEEKTVAIVGVDEMDIGLGYITFLSPLAKALLGASEGDVVPFQSPGGRDELEVLEIAYREIPMRPFESR